MADQNKKLKTLLFIADELKKSPVTCRELSKLNPNVKASNFYTFLMRLEQMGFMVYEESIGVSGNNSVYGLLKVAKGSFAEKYFNNQENLGGKHDCKKGNRRN